MSQSDVRTKNIKQVLDAATTLFKENGIENTTIEQIAAECKLTTRSVYRYFETKDTLVLAVISAFWRQMYATIDEIFCSVIERDITGYEMLKIIFSSTYDVYLQTKASMMMVQEMQSFIYKHGIKISDVAAHMGEFKSYHAPLVIAMQKGIADGTLRSDLDIVFTRNFAQNMIVGLMQKLTTVEADEKANAAFRPKEQLETMASMMLEYMRTK